jgi:hypothetical protein
MRSNVRVFLASAGMLFLTHGSVARADDGGRAEYADHLFHEGVELMKEHNCPQAIPKFVASQQLDPKAATVANLGSCYEKVGRSASAWYKYREGATLATTEGNLSLRDQILGAIATLTPTLTRLRVIPPRGTSAPSITLNGEPLADDGMPIALDPGENIIEASAPGRQPWRRSLSAEVGATIVIEVPELPKTEQNLTWRPTALIAGGAGASLIIVGSILGLSAKASRDESRDHCKDGYCTSAGIDLRNDADHKATLSNYAVAAGAILAGAGVALWFALPAHTEHAVTVAPWIPSPDAPLGVSLRGRL